MTIYYIIGAILLLVAIIASMYNGLVKINTRVDEAWSDITVQLKRRTDLIPNLINTVKGYAKHEKEVFEQVTEARSGLMNAQGVAETAKAENAFQQTLKSLFAVAEAYPELKASDNFQKLQDELTDTEDKIEASRRFYNGNVRDFNTDVQMFPGNIIAGMFSFKVLEFFELEQDSIEKNPVEVKF